MPNGRKPNIALMLGSAPDVMRCKLWPREPFRTIVAINNAWLVRPDYDYLVHAGDFSQDRLPTGNEVKFASIVSASDYVPAQNAFGGFVYAGGTMAFTTAYWVIHRLKPKVLAFLGCDMVYDSANGSTHFYGNGTPDPLRRDVTLQSLEAKSARLFVHGIRNGTLCVNLSRLPASRLILPRVDVGSLNTMSEYSADLSRKSYEEEIDDASENAAKQLEQWLGYFVADGRYWEQSHRFDTNSLRQLDEFWLSAVRKILTAEFTVRRDPEGLLKAQAGGDAA